MMRTHPHTPLTSPPASSPPLRPPLGLHPTPLPTPYSLPLYFQRCVAKGAPFVFVFVQNGGKYEHFAFRFELKKTVCFSRVSHEGKKTAKIWSYLTWKAKLTSLTPINPPPPPPTPTALEIVRVVYSIRHILKSEMCSHLSIEQTIHRNKNNIQLYWNAQILLCSVVDPLHFGTDPDPRIRFTDLWIRIWILFFPRKLTRCRPKKSFLKSFLLIRQSSKIKSQKEVTK